jgi:hypothetical protein
VQYETYQQVKDLRTRLILLRCMSPYSSSVIIPPRFSSLPTVNDPRVTWDNREALENALFLNEAEVQKLFEFTKTHAFGEGVPYKTTLTGLRIG